MVESNNVEGAEEHFLSHPETADAGGRIFEAVQREGDRGAMLVAGEILSAFLENALRSIQPDALPKEEVDRLLKGVGPLASWSARIKVTALVGLISPRTREALDDLRDVRNKAAHSESPFELATYRVRIRRAFDLGPGISVTVNRMALELGIYPLIDTLTEEGLRLEAELGTNPFGTLDQIKEQLKRQDVRQELEGRVWRLELGIGVWLLLGVMRLERDQFLSKVQSSSDMAP